MFINPHYANSGTISQLPFSPTLLLIVFSTIVTFWVWQPAPHNRSKSVESGLAALAILLFGVSDWVLITSLPRLNLSYGPLEPAFLGISILRLFILFVTLLPMLLRNVQRIIPFKKEAIYQTFSIRLALLWGLNFFVLLCAFDGLYIEPFTLTTSEVNLPVQISGSKQPLRILHLSDLHIERMTKREQKLIDRVKTLDPDLILWTGDYLNVDYLDDPQTRKDAKRVLSEISAPHGVYAVIGTVDRQDIMEDLFSDLGVTVLQDEIQKLDFERGELYLVGVSNFYIERDRQALHKLMETVPEAGYSILLYHTPDLAYDAAREKVDLYLAGHTHGGQIRLPFYGALVTFSVYGKQFESGLFNIDQTKLYVSRGIGMEGLNLPRVRFLCPPEIILFNLGS